MTGTNRNWTNATPDNPFGSGPNQSSPQLQMVNPGLSYQQPQTTGFINQTPLSNQTHNIDKYAVFKTLDTSSSSSSIFNQHQNNGQNRPFY
ncbi:hypothetical protein A0J61_10788 [Choanephora cucurbitarum]|uniref:Uncharacterized protein n=1 Tax=Choanephora cucurbitarum TaxID=101091 RepID=A0A1C7MWA2_9FUNG|nr:hypothetical protein A0J61_10788 [Choanephora cucurbitarum]